MPFLALAFRKNIFLILEGKNFKHFLSMFRRRSVSFCRSLLKENFSTSDFQNFIEKSCLLNEMRVYFDEFSSSPSVLLKKWINDESDFVVNQVVDDNIVDVIRSFRWAVLHKRLTDVKKDVFIDAVNCFANFTERRIDCYRSKNMASVRKFSTKIFYICFQLLKIFLKTRLLLNWLNNFKIASTPFVKPFQCVRFTSEL